MKRRTTMLVLAAFLLAGAYWFFIERTKPTTTEKRAAKLGVVGAGWRVTGFGIDGIRAYRAPDGWRIGDGGREFPGARAVCEAVREKLGALAGVDAGRSFATDGKILHRIRLDVENLGGVKAVREFFVFSGPARGIVYLSEADGSRVWTLDAEALDVLAANREAFREARLFPFDPRGFRWAEATDRTTGEAVRLELGHGGRWRLTQPLTDDAVRVTDTPFVALLAAQVLWQEIDVGADAGGWLVRGGFSDGEQTYVVRHVAADTWAVAGGNLPGTYPAVFAAGTLPIDPQKIRLARIGLALDGELRRIVLDGFGTTEPIEMRRLESGFWIVDPFLMKSDAPTIDDFLRKLGTIRIDAFVDEKPGGAPSFAVTLEAGAGDAGGRETIAFYETPDGVVGWNERRRTAFVPLAADVARLPRGRTALVSRQLYRFDPAEVEVVKIERAGRTFRIVRRQGDWRVAEPANWPAERGYVPEFFRALLEYRIPEFFEAGADFSEKNAAARISFGFAERERPAEAAGIDATDTHETLLIGRFRERDEAYYGSFGKTGLYFPLSGELVALALKDPRDGRIVPYARADLVRSVTLVTGEARRVLRRTGDEFLLDGETVDRARALRLLDGLIDVRAAELADDLPEDAPQSEMIFEIAYEKEPARLFFYRDGGIRSGSAPFVFMAGKEIRKFMELFEN